MFDSVTMNRGMRQVVVLNTFLNTEARDSHDSKVGHVH